MAYKGPCEFRLQTTANRLSVPMGLQLQVFILSQKLSRILNSVVVTVLISVLLEYLDLYKIVFIFERGHVIHVTPMD